MYFHCTELSAGSKQHKTKPELGGNSRYLQQSLGLDVKSTWGESLSASRTPELGGMSSVQPSPSFLSSPPDLQIPHWFKLSLPKACKLVRTSKREKNRNGVLAHRAALPPHSRLTSPHFERSSPWKERQREQKQTCVLLEIFASDTSLSLKIFKLGITPPPPASFNVLLLQSLQYLCTFSVRD